MVTLAEAKMNTSDALDLAVIDEFRKSSWLLDSMEFDDCVNPAGGGASLTYTYTRLASQPTADFRAYNAEYTKNYVTRSRHSVDLYPLGGAFEVDRVLGNLGPQATNEVSLQMEQKVKAARTFFQQQVILGDNATDSGFDGLDVALTGSDTEYRVGEVSDWRGATIGADQGLANDAIDALDDWLAMLDDEPTAILANRDGIGRVRSLARRAGYYARNRDDFGRQVESYGNIVLIDLGNQAGTNNPIIPTETRTVATVSTDNLTDLYAVRLGMNGFHGVGVQNAPLVRQWLPDFETAGAVKTGEVEMGPVATALKATKAAAVYRNIQVR